MSKNKVTINKTIHSTELYYCPMHCEGDKMYNDAGSCPVCGMDLVKQVVVSSHSLYACPMHPEVQSDGPGSCSICGMDLVPVMSEAENEDKTYLRLKQKLIISTVFTIPIFIIAMTEMWHDNPMYKLFSLKTWNIIELVLSLPVLFYATWMFFVKAWNSLLSRNLNMFTLIGIGAGVAWIFSCLGIFFPEWFPENFKTHQGTVFVYFEAATVILTLVLMGQVLEARAHGRTNTAVKELMKLAPNKATKLVNGVEEIVKIEAIRIGDLIRVKPGEKVPVDGEVVEGTSIIDESMVTGEPIPVEKEPGSAVISGTINGNKSFVMVAQKVGSETLLARIVEMVNNASRSKAPIQKIADKISGYFVPIVILVSLFTFLVWFIWGPSPTLAFAFVNAIAVLIIACPCALGLATPMSIMVGVGKGAQSGVLIKDAGSLELLSSIDVLVVDKTGTLTEGKPSVQKIVVIREEISENEMIQKIMSLNQFSEHPLAKATMDYGREKNIQIKEIIDFETIVGKGVVCKLGGEILALGNAALMSKINAEISPSVLADVREFQMEGKTVSFFAIGNIVVGYVVIADSLKRQSADAIRTLQNLGLQIFMFTGDNEDTARSVSKALKLNGFQAQMLPGDKQNEIIKLQATGRKIAMAGDGINDAPALSQADIGIAMGTGTDVAIQSAGITLVKGDLNGIVKARKLSEKVMRNIRENLFFAMAYNILGIPIAAGVLYPYFGILLSPMIAALAMSFSSVSVITNALRLRRLKL